MSHQLNLIELTPQQSKAWADTRAALVWHCPAFTHLLYTMLNNGGNNELIAVFTDAVPIAATDGSNLIINPETFFAYNLNERIFIVAHEISHCMFAHCEMLHRFKATGKVPYPDGKVLSFDMEDMNKAMDYVINDMLVQGKVGHYNPDWLHDTTIATQNDSVLTAYRRIHQDNGGSGGQGGGAGSPQGNGQGQGKPNQKSFDQHLAPGTTTGQDPHSAANGRNDMGWKTAIAGAIASAKAQGKMPAGMERLFGAIIEPEVDWTDKVLGFFARNTGSGTYNWRKVDRRLIVRDIVAPGRTGFGAGAVVVGLDTSGSIGQAELDVFFGEMSGILNDVNPQVVYLMYCDARVHAVEEIVDLDDLTNVRQKKAPGGGGTAFEPVFDMIREMDIQPDALIYLTDGYGSFPKDVPAYPVIWGDTTGKVDYPWGEVVSIPIK